MGIQDAIMREMDVEEYEAEMARAEVMREMGAEECGAEMGPSIDLNLDVDEMRDSIMGSLQVANLDEDDASIFANQMACDLYMMLEKVADRYLRDEFKKMGLKYDDRIPTDEELDIMDQM